MRLLSRRRHVRQLVPRVCAYCSGKFFTHRGDKPRLFRSNKCRQAEYRAKNSQYQPDQLEAQNSTYRNVSVHPTRVTNTPSKTADASAASNTLFADRASFPINLIGGYRFAGAPVLDRELVRNILKTEGR